MMSADCIFHCFVVVTVAVVAANEIPTRPGNRWITFLGGKRDATAVSVPLTDGKSDKVRLRSDWSAMRMGKRGMTLSEGRPQLPQVVFAAPISERESRVILPPTGLLPQFGTGSENWVRLSPQLRHKNELIARLLNYLQNSDDDASEDLTDSSQNNLPFLLRTLSDQNLEMSSQRNDDDEEEEELNRDDEETNDESPSRFFKNEEHNLTKRDAATSKSIKVMRMGKRRNFASEVDRDTIPSEFSSRRRNSFQPTAEDEPLESQSYFRRMFGDVDGSGSLNHPLDVTTKRYTWKRPVHMLRMGKRFRTRAFW